MFIVEDHQSNIMMDEAAKEDKVWGVLWRVLEMHVMDKMVLFGACGNLILSDACFGVVVVRRLLLVGTVLYIWYTTDMSSLGMVLAWTILGRALGFIYFGEYSEFGTNHLHCF